MSDRRWHRCRPQAGAHGRRSPPEARRDHSDPPGTGTCASLRRSPGKAAATPSPQGQGPWPIVARDPSEPARGTNSVGLGVEEAGLISFLTGLTNGEYLRRDNGAGGGWLKIALQVRALYR